jgi:nucleoside-diphosphate-sugar epimerase
MEIKKNPDSVNYKNHKEGDSDYNRCLVIGGAGLLGYEIANQLYNHGKQVRILDTAKFADSRFEILSGDIRNEDDTENACSGIEAVFQTAAAVWNPETAMQIFDEVNIQGNMNVINSCKKCGVKKLIYTSTMDVVVDGKKPIIDGDETLPYPAKMPSDPYSRTKIVAEKMTLEANSSNLSTCALRPVGMYGPRDKYHIANIIKAVLAGTNFRLGNKTAKFSHVYSENAAYAHILAADRLYPGSPVSGNFYFITDSYPSENLFDFMAPFLEGLGLKPPVKSIPYRLAYILAFINEKINQASNFNRFAVIQTCVDHTFKSIRAEQDLGYKPLVSRQEAFEKTLEWFSQNINSI